MVFLWDQAADLRPGTNDCLVSNNPPWSRAQTMTAGLKGQGERFFKRDRCRIDADPAHAASNWLMTLIMWLDSLMKTWSGFPWPVCTSEHWSPLAYFNLSPSLCGRRWNSAAGSQRPWGSFPSFFVFQPCSSIPHARSAAAICHPVLQQWLLPSPSPSLSFIVCLPLSISPCSITLSPHSSWRLAITAYLLSLPLLPLLIFQGTSDPQCVVWDYGNP